MTENLRPKQQLFADEYLKDLNATQAAIRAGYSKKTACAIGTENLRKPNIQSYIEQKQQEIAKKNDISIDWIINELKETYSACRRAIPVLDHEGNETGEYKFESSSAVRSLELLGKHLGMFTDRIRLERPQEAEKKITVEIIDSRLSERKK